MWDVEKGINFLGILNPQRLELKFLTYKLTLLLVLTGSSRAHEICCLNILYFVRHSFSYNFHFSKVSKTAKKGKIRPPMKFLNFTLREKCPYSELFWSVFSRIRTEYAEILRSECGKIQTFRAIPI